MKPTFTKDDREKLQHLGDLLQLFHHRNRNQHRRSAWWRHFSILRKQIRALVNDIQILTEVPNTHVARVQKKACDPQIRDQIQQRLQFWQDTQIGRWQHASSQVTADGRFSVLGLMLLATLAETCKITGITASLEDLGQAEVERALQRFAEEGWDESVLPVGSFGQSNEDVGEVIERQLKPEADDLGVPGMKSQSLATTTGQSRVLEQKKKKKRKKGDAIDDLFSGLG